MFYRYFIDKNVNETSDAVNIIFKLCVCMNGKKTNYYNYNKRHKKMFVKFQFSLAYCFQHYIFADLRHMHAMGRVTLWLCLIQIPIKT